MKYFINPKWFYWIHVIGGVRKAFKTGCIFILVLAFGLLLMVFVSDFNSDLLDKSKKMGKLLCVVLAVFLVGYIAIPSERTIVEIMIAKYATAENLKLTLDSIKNAADYIVEDIKPVW